MPVDMDAAFPVLAGAAEFNVCVARGVGFFRDLHLSACGFFKGAEFVGGIAGIILVENAAHAATGTHRVVDKREVAEVVDVGTC